MNHSATFIGFIAIALWSGLALLTAASGTMPPFQLAAITFAIGGGCGLAVTAARRRLDALRQPWPVWLVGVGGLFGYHALYFGALRLAPPAEAGLIAYLWPLLIVLLSALLPGEHLRARHVLGAAMGLGGVFVLLFGARLARGQGLTLGEGLGLEARYLPGYGLALACAVVWSVYSVLSRRFRQVPTEAVAGFCVVTAALAWGAHLMVEQTVWPTGFGQWLAIAALGLGPVGLAFYVWDYGVKHGDIRTLGVASYAAPVLSTLILVSFGFAAASWALAIACALIVAGALIAAL